MDWYGKLPFLLGGSMAIITGILGYSSGAGNNKTYLYMLLAMLAFYFMGRLLGDTLRKINEEVKEKKKAEEQKLNAAMPEDNDGKADRTVAGGNSSKGHRINLSADDKVDTSSGKDDGFEPLTVSRVIASKMKED